jgi:hypothetical protein
MHYTITTRTQFAVKTITATKITTRHEMMHPHPEIEHPSFITRIVFDGDRNGSISESECSGSAFISRYFLKCLRFACCINLHSENQDEHLNRILRR